MRFFTSGTNRRTSEGRSFRSKKGGGTQLGEKMFPYFITLRSDPFHKLYPALPWGAGGLPSAPLTWIENGVVKNLFYDRYWALKAGKEPTPFPSNLILDGGSKSLEELKRTIRLEKYRDWAFYGRLREDNIEAAYNNLMTYR